MKKLTIIIIVCLSMLLSGCTGGIYRNYIDVEQLQLIQTLGIDGAPGSLTVSVSSGRPLDGGEPVVLSGSGFTISDAMKKLQDYAANEQLYYAHILYIIIGEDAAKQGIAPILDYIERNMQIRISTDVFVTRGCTAKELITGAGDPDYDITQSLSAVKRDTDRRGDSHVFTCLDMARDLSEVGAALSCAVSAAQTDGTVFMKEAGTTAIPAGYAVFKDGRLVSFIEGTAAAMTSLLNGDLGVASVEVHIDGKTVTLDIDSSDAKIKPRWTVGRLDSIDIKVSVGAGVAETDGEISALLSEDVQKKLKDALEAQLEKSLTEVLAIAKDADADFLGLNNLLRKDDPGAYAALPEGWLKDAKFHLSVEAEIEHSYELGDPVSVDGGDSK